MASLQIVKDKLVADDSTDQEIMHTLADYRHKF